MSAYSRLTPEARGLGMTSQRARDRLIERLQADLPLPQLHLPFVFTGDLGPSELDYLADALTKGVDALTAPR